MYYKYYINLDERGEFYANVREDGGKIVFEITDYDHLWELIEGAWMEDKQDTHGLREYLIQNHIMTDEDRLVSG